MYENLFKELPQAKLLEKEACQEKRQKKIWQKNMRTLIC